MNDDHYCFCGAFGTYGTHVNLVDWRKGCIWRCKAHRGQKLPAPLGAQAPVSPLAAQAAGPAPRQGSLL
jgi:hypothetical protein